MEPSFDEPVKLPMPAFLSGGGEMGRLIRSYNWSESSLGPVNLWPQSLRSALSICLNSNFPIAIYWGKELTLLYNDAWSPIPGNKHPWALGKGAKEVWPDIWDAIEPQFAKAFNGEPGGSKDALLPMQRHGYTEECYFDFTFTPVYGEGGKIEGVFNAVIETTYRIISERRTAFLKNLALKIAEEKTKIQLLKQAIDFIKNAAPDVPFALIYAATATAPALIGSTFADTEQVAQKQAWPFEKVQSSGKSFYIENIKPYFEHVPKNYWPEEPQEGYIIPLTSSTGSNLGFLVCGLSARRRIDEDYRLYLETIGNTIVTAYNITAALEEERKKAEALAEIDKAKTVFFSNVSHEFRTPLTLMLGSLEELLKKPVHQMGEENRTTVETTHRNALRLLRLVNNLLDFSRIEAGRAKARYQPTDLARLTEELAGSFRSVIENAGLQYRVACSTISQPVYVDRSMWEKIVLNLISNAFKYTLKGTISVSLSVQGGRAVLSVKDTGVGIPEKELPKMFERFHRVENVTGRSYEGSGIGLSLISELVKLHHGEITVTSTEGKGSDFVVALPLGKNHLPADQVANIGTNEDFSLSDVLVAEAATLLETSLAANEPAELQQGDSKPVVLVVDDNTDMRRYFKTLLEKDYQVVAATNGSDALHKVKEALPDLIVSDIMMPVMDGMALLKAIKENSFTASVPVILVSARAGENEKVEGYNVGADDYLVKPFSSKELLARVRSQISLSKKRDKTLQEVYAVFNEVPFAVAVLKGEALTIEFINKYNLDIWQKTRGEVLGKPLFEARPDIRSGAAPLHAEVYRTGKRFVASEVPIELTTNGKTETRYFNAVIDPLFNEQGNITGQLATSIEITEQVLARKKIEESENRFRTLADALPQMVWMRDGEGNIEFGSRHWEEYSGINDVSTAWKQMVHPDDWGPVMQAWDRHFTRGESFHYEVRLKNKEGEYKWHYAVAEPIRDAGGQVLKWIGAVIDIQVQKTFSENLEKLVAERTLALQRSNEDLQQFAHVASHDLKEPVRKVMTFSNRLKDELSSALSPTASSYLSKIESSAIRMYAMIDGVLLYSSLNALEQTKELIDLNELMQNIEEDLEVPFSEKGATLIFEKLPGIQGSAILMYQLFYNLINNALKFAKADQPPVILLTAQQAAPEDIKRTHLEENGSYLKIVLKDNGIGFRDKDAEKIFGAFTRLHSKDKYEGTGLGLALCRKIVERHKGAIYAEGTEGTGASFTILLPE